MTSYRISVRASDELLNTYLRGIELFGRHQADRYLDELHSIFDLLADSPHMGRLAPRAGKDVRRHEHGSHVVFYREMDGAVLILGVVHAHRVCGLRF